jgi:uncharacterized protein
VIRAVLDTNVIVSSLITLSGSPHEILNAWFRGDIVLITSAAIVNEVSAVLRRPFFQDKRHIGEADILRIKQSLLLDAVVVSPKKCLTVIETDPSDDRILECALEGDAEYIVSGDHHLLELGQYQGIQIISPREFLAVLGRDEADFDHV